jgi:tetratricopeptide (TPR) repeat protein
MRELLADLLMEMKEPAEALREYETSLKATPNRFRGLSGAGRAADASGDRAKASGYFKRVLELAKSADSDRSEIREAKAFMARK